MSTALHPLLWQPCTMLQAVYSVVPIPVRPLMLCRGHASHICESSHMTAG